MDELLKKLAAIDQQLADLLAKDELTDDERTRHDQLVADYKRTADQIDRKRQANARAAETARLADEARQSELLADANRRREAAVVVASTGVNRVTNAASPLATAVRTDEQGRVTAFFEDTDESLNLRFGDSSDAQRNLSYRQQKRRNRDHLKSCGYTPWGEFKSAADFIRSGFDSHDSSRFRERVHRHYAAVSGMSEGSGSDGGYTVMPEFAAGIIDRMYSNDLWGRTDNYSVNGNNLTFLVNAETSRATGSRHGGMRGYWLGEGGSITSSKPTLREVTLKLAKLGVVVYLTNELLSDGGSALVEYISRKAAEEFNFMIGDALVNGTGVGQPLGILNFPSLVSVAKEAGQLAATLETENILKMFSRVYAPARNNMIWLHNQDIEPELFSMTLGVGTGGVVTYMPPGGVSGSPYANLMGRPLVPTEFNATLGTQGDLIAADLRQVLSISKGGVAQAVSMHVQFLTDQLAVRFTMRLNAGPWESAPITPYKGASNTQACFVALDTRA